MLRIEDCQPGALVECINVDGCTPELTLGAIYTVREFVPDDWSDTGRCGVLVEEWPGDSGFYLFHFRLLPGARLLSHFQAVLKSRVKELT